MMGSSALRSHKTYPAGTLHNDIQTNARTHTSDTERMSRKARQARAGQATRACLDLFYGMSVWPRHSNAGHRREKGDRGAE